MISKEDGENKRCWQLKKDLLNSLVIDVVLAQWSCQLCLNKLFVQQIQSV